MTYEELRSIPEIEPNHFGTKIQVRTECRGEVRVAIPVMPGADPLWREPADPFGAIDEYGDYWEIGRVEGVLVKRRAPLPLCMR